MRHTIMGLLLIILAACQNTDQTPWLPQEEEPMCYVDIVFTGPFTYMELTALLEPFIQTLNANNITYHVLRGEFLEKRYRSLVGYDCTTAEIQIQAFLDSFARTYPQLLKDQNIASYSIDAQASCPTVYSSEYIVSREEICPPIL